MFTQKGASQQGFLLLFLLFFPSLCGSLLLQEPAGLLQAGSGTGVAECCSRQGVLWVTFPDAADPSGPASLLLPRPSAWPPGLLLLSTGCLQGGVGLADFLELILNPALASAGAWSQSQAGISAKGGWCGEGVPLETSLLELSLDSYLKIQSLLQKQRPHCSFLQTGGVPIPFLPRHGLAFLANLTQVN